MQARLVQDGVPTDVVDRFASATALDDTTIIATLPQVEQTAVLQGFSDSVRTVFAAAAVLLVPTFLLALCVEEEPLRTQGGIAAAQADVDTETALPTTKSKTAAL